MCATHFEDEKHTQNKYKTIFARNTRDTPCPTILRRANYVIINHSHFCLNRGIFAHFYCMGLYKTHTPKDTTENTSSYTHNTHQLNVKCDLILIFLL